jgi:hypothetical protein
MTWLGRVVLAIMVGVTVPAMAAGAPQAVGLPDDPLKLDYACMARLWSEWQDINDGFESAYTQATLEEAVNEWAGDASARTGRAPEDLAAGAEVKAEADTLVDLLEAGKFAPQLAYCADQRPGGG